MELNARKESVVVEEIKAVELYYINDFGEVHDRNAHWLRVPL